MTNKKIVTEEVKHVLDHGDDEIEVRVRYLKNGDVTVAGYFVHNDKEVPGTQQRIPANERHGDEWLRHRLGFAVEEARIAVRKFGRTGEPGVSVDVKV
ncbi:hypothetical protein QZM66_23120 [Burkholderia contaminans]|uniref:hypothetical protein n=1 Tax=Burkholderia contaminans TaxID=488447 RepID=UPI00264AF73A|nr:hypothetical protein [Burkholderia contaminans]MDN7790460.1 hypothetical protein [Burkholderia contaminans]